LLFVLLVVLGLVAAACGDDDDTEAGGDTGTEEPAADEAADGGEATTEEPATDCGVDALALKTPGQLTVATGEAVFPPWVLNDDPAGGEGFEAALVYALAEQMGFTPDQVSWVGTSFDDAISPAPKDYDFNIQQYSITPERDEVVDFSDGYYNVEQAIIGVEGSSVVGAASLADLKDKRLGAAIGTTSLAYIEDVIQPDTAASAFDDNAAVKSAFDAGQIDGAVFDLPTAYYVTAVEIEGSSIVGVLPQVGDAPEQLGMLFEDGSTLVPCVNAALGALRDAGTLDALEDEWLNQGGSIPTLTE
jgi:polar amino acid transport system substrate-binding protein